MATKRRTEQEPQRPRSRSESQPVEAAAPDRPASGSGGRADEEAKTGERAAKPAEEATADRRVEEVSSQLEEANARYVRLAADFDNYKKRARQEQSDTMRFAAATVAERLLPVLDDAERALEHVPDGVDENWLKGVRLTFQKLQEVLAALGVERVESVGSPFDPKLHEAVGSDETSEHPEDTVTTELRPGYRMHDRILRPALVKVARAPA
jgi:molecular chaperone GrpE